MAMLAERRVHKKYVLQPRGKAVYEDEKSFGLKMLQKMGWKFGKGLGRNEDGSLNFIQVNFKNDELGLGYQKLDDQWTKHDTDFNSLLKKLNQNENYTVTNDSVKMKEQFSGESLEEKSKKSKVRVHYKKFAKGKDLTQYSEKDLANIFGKKPREYLEDQSNNVSNEIQQDKKCEKTNDGKESIMEIYEPGNEISKEESNKKAKKKKRKNTEKDYSLETCEQKAVTDDETSKSPKIQKNIKKKKTNELIENKNVYQSNNISKEIQQDKECENTNDGNKSIVEVEIDESENEICKEELSKKANKKKRKNNEKDYSLETSKQKAVSGDETTQSQKIQKNIKKKISNELSENKNEKESAIDCQERKRKETEIGTQQETGNEAIGNKSKKNKRKDSVIETDTQFKNADKTKDPYSKTETESEENMEIDESLKIGSLETPKKAKRKFNETAEKDSTKVLETDQTKTETEHFHNKYVITSFCAEKFQATAFDQFIGSNLAEINGYGIDESTKLEIRQSQKDKQQIIWLWSKVIRKYESNPNKKSKHKKIKVKKIRKRQIFQRV